MGYDCDHYTQNPGDCGLYGMDALYGCCECGGGLIDYKRTFYAQDPKTIYGAFTFLAWEYLNFRYEALYAP